MKGGDGMCDLSTAAPVGAEGVDEADIADLIE